MNPGIIILFILGIDLIIIMLLEVFRKKHNKINMGDELGFDKEKEYYPDKQLIKMKRDEEKMRKQIDKINNRELLKEELKKDKEKKKSMLEQVDDDNAIEVDYEEIKDDEYDKSSFFS